MRMYYQPKGGKKGMFALRENTYRRMRYLIADYRYFKCVETGLAEAEYWQQKGEQPPVPEAKQQTGKRQMTAEAQAVYAAGRENFDRDQIRRYITAIEEAQKKVPSAYVDYIMGHIIDKVRYKDMPGVSERTMKIWVQRFVWQVAHNLGEV